MAKDLVYRVKIVPDSKSLKDFASQGSRSQETVEKSIRSTTQELNRQIELLDLYRQKGEITSEELEQGFMEIDQALKRIPVSTRDVIRSQKKLMKAQQASRGSTVDFDKATRNANQTLFSFGDIVNDAQQFQFGFAQGTRAIGNNIGFMAEQLSNVNNRAGGFKGTLQALGGSLMGPGGIIIGINLAVSALTLFGDKLFDAKEEVKDTKGEFDSFKNTLDSVSGALESAGVFGDDPFNLKSLRFDRRRIKREIQTIESIIQETGGSFTDEDRKRLNMLIQQRKAGVDLNDAQQRIFDNLRTEQRLYRQNSDIISDYEDDLENLNDSLDDLNKKIREQERAQREFGDQVGRFINKDLEDQVSKAFSDQLTTTQQILENEKAFQDTFLEEERDKQTRKLQDFLDFGEQMRINEINRRIKREKQAARAILTIERQAAQAKQALRQQALGTASDIINQAFGESKGARIATTILDTIAAAQGAYASQLVPGDPSSFVRAKIAAGIASAQGLARIATMRSITPESQGAGGIGGGRSEGFSGGEVSGDQSRTRGSNNRTRNTRDIESVRGENQSQINIELRTEADSKVVSKKAEDGRKQRVKTAVRVRSD